MDNSLVSVIMPTFNHADYLKEAIESVLAQTYSNLELIVVDNFSTDDTEKITTSFKDSRIRYFKFSNHGIIAASRNYGIKKAEGEFIAFLDSDDYWLNSKLALQIKAFQINEKIGISFCLFKTKADIAIENEKILGPKKRVLPKRIYEQLIKANFIVSSSVVVRKSVLDRVGIFDEAKELVCSEDFDLWLRIVRQYEAAFIAQICGVYRVHGKNESANELRLQKALAVITKHEQKGWASPDLVQYASASFYFQVAWTLVQENRKLARVYFRKALKIGCNHPRILCVSFMGLALSFVPKIYGFMKSRKIDKKLSKYLLNSQNI